MKSGMICCSGRCEVSIAQILSAGAEHVQRGGGKGQRRESRQPCSVIFLHQVRQDPRCLPKRAEGAEVARVCWTLSNTSGVDMRTALSTELLGRSLCMK
jgi:hypothetical protein